MLQTILSSRRGKVLGLVGLVTVLCLCVAVAGSFLPDSEDEPAVAAAQTATKEPTTEPTTAPTAEPTQTPEPTMEPTATELPPTTEPTENAYCDPGEVVIAAAFMSEVIDMYTALGESAQNIEQTMDFTGLYVDAMKLDEEAQDLFGPPCMQTIITELQAATGDALEGIELIILGSVDEGTAKLDGSIEHMEAATQSMQKLTACMPDCQPEDLR